MYLTGGTELLAEWKRLECKMDQRMVAVQGLPYVPTPLNLYTYVCEQTVCRRYGRHVCQI